MSTHPTLTKRELREQRRAERLAAERAEAAAGARRVRAWRLLGALAASAAVVAVAVAVSSGGAERPATPAVPPQASLFAGLPEQGGVLGDPDAPLTVTEYVDLQCPVCAVAARESLPTLIRDYVRTGKVKLEARTLHFIGPDSERAARVAAGAEAQGRLWPFLEAFYAAQGQENSGYVTDDFLRSVARAAGVDADAALKAAGGAAAQDRLNRANADAQRLGVDATPTFTVARGDGAARVLGSGAQEATALSAHSTARWPDEARAPGGLRGGLRRGAGDRRLPDGRALRRRRTGVRDRARLRGRAAVRVRRARRDPGRRCSAWAATSRSWPRSPARARGRARPPRSSRSPASGSRPG